MPILNYTTEVDTLKSLIEIQKCLSSHGAKKISIDYDEDGDPVALTFCIMKDGNLIGFSLPANYEGVLKVMQKQKVAPRYLNSTQALRVSWRILKDWVEAQMALVMSEQATAMEVFLPYAITRNGETVREMMGKDTTLFLTQ